MRWRPILYGVFLLLLGSYLDNSRGPLMPALTRVLGLGYTQVSWMLVAGFLAAIAITFGMLALVARRTDRQLAAWVLWAGVAATAFSLVVTDLSSLLCLGAILGVAIAGLGAVSNLLVLENTSAEYKARMMCFLHSMYGWGSFLGPGLVGWTVGEGDRWQTPLLVALPLMGGLLVASRWLGEEPHREVQRAKSPMTAEQWWAVVVIASYAGGEVLISTWMVTYLVEGKRMALVGAAPFASAFFLMMGLTRLGCVFSVKPRHETLVLVGCLVAAMGAFVIGRLGSPWGLPLAGLFGPFFPLFVARVGKAFPVQARSLTLVILGGMQVVLCGLHLLVGRLTDVVGIETAYWLPLVLLGFSLFSLVIYISRERAVVS